MPSLRPGPRLIVLVEAHFWSAVVLTVGRLGVRGALCVGVLMVAVTVLLAWANSLRTIGRRESARADVLVARSVAQLSHPKAGPTVDDILDLARRAGVENLRIAFVRAAENSGEPLSMLATVRPPVLYVTDSVFGMSRPTRRAAIAHELGHTFHGGRIGARLRLIGLVVIALWLAFGATLVAAPPIALVPKGLVLGVGIRLGLFLRDLVVEPQVDSTISWLGEDPAALASYLRIAPGTDAPLGARILDRVRWAAYRDE